MAVHSTCPWNKWGGVHFYPSSCHPLSYSWFLSTVKLTLHPWCIYSCTFPKCLPTSRCMSKSAAAEPVWQVANRFNTAALSAPTDCWLRSQSKIQSVIWACPLHTLRAFLSLGGFVLKTNWEHVSGVSTTSGALYSMLMYADVHKRQAVLCHSNKN